MSDRLTWLKNYLERIDAEMKDSDFNQDVKIGHRWACSSIRGFIEGLMKEEVK